jgi:hypothetical protein
VADDWQCSWASKEERKLVLALAWTPAERLRWLEEIIRLAWLRGALPRPRPEAETRRP